MCCAVSIQRQCHTLYTESCQRGCAECTSCSSNPLRECPNPRLQNVRRRPRQQRQQTMQNRRKVVCLPCDDSGAARRSIPACSRAGQLKAELALLLPRSLQTTNDNTVMRFVKAIFKRMKSNTKHAHFRCCPCSSTVSASRFLSSTMAFFKLACLLAHRTDQSNKQQQKRC